MFVANSPVDVRMKHLFVLIAGPDIFEPSFGVFFDPRMNDNGSIHWIEICGFVVEESGNRVKSKGM